MAATSVSVYDELLLLLLEVEVSEKMCVLWSSPPTATSSSAGETATHVGWNRRPLRVDATRGVGVGVGERGEEGWRR